MDDSTTKRCPKCGQTKSVGEFPKSKHKPDGFAGHCKACKRRDYQEKRGDYIERSRQYQRAHADQVNARLREYRARNAERVRAQNRNRRQLDLFRFREQGRRKEAKRQGVMRGYIVDYAAIWNRDRGICHICGLLVDRSDAHFDHIIPLSKGGMHSYDNIKVAHATCNLRKGAKLL